MKKFLMMAVAAVVSLALMSCSDGSNSDSDSGDNTPVQLLEEGATYKSADKAFDGTQTITVTMTSAVAGKINHDDGDDEAFTIDSTTGALTYTGNDDPAVSHILKVGEKIYALGSPSVSTSDTLVGTWDCGEDCREMIFTADKVTFNNKTFAYTNENGIIKVTVGGGEQIEFLFARSKLFFKFAELTKQ